MPVASLSLLGGTSLCKDIWDRLGTVIGAGIIISVWKVLWCYFHVCSCRTSLKVVCVNNLHTHTHVHKYTCKQMHVCSCTGTRSAHSHKQTKQLNKLYIIWNCLYYTKQIFLAEREGVYQYLNAMYTARPEHEAGDILHQLCKEFFRLFFSGNCRLHCIMWM